MRTHLRHYLQQSTDLLMCEASWLTQDVMSGWNRRMELAHISNSRINFDGDWLITVIPKTWVNFCTGKRNPTVSSLRLLRLIVNELERRRRDDEEKGRDEAPAPKQVYF